MINQKKEEPDLNRRTFAKIAAAGLLFVQPEQVRGTDANSAIRVGLLGCGARGSTVVDAMTEVTNTRVVALADLFADKLESAKAHYDERGAKKGHAAIERKMMFRGPKAYRAIASAKDLDAIVLATPDYFHGEHLDAIVEAGKHVYCEKPAAVDVAGCKRFLEIGRKAQGRLSLEIGFEVRYAPGFRGIVERIHAAHIGNVGAISGYYHAPAITYPERPNASALEKRIRNFYWDRILSGDVIVDQNIHMIDICNWALKAHPVKAIGAGGRKVRKDPGDVWDHFSITLTYPDGVHFSFNSVQFGSSFWDVGMRFLGEKGVAEAYYSGRARVLGPQPWVQEADAKLGEQQFSTRGNFDALGGMDQIKTKSFIDSIVTGKYHNEAAEGAQSALSAILARTAAYTGREVTWDELLASDQSYAGAIDLSPLE